MRVYLNDTQITVYEFMKQFMLINGYTYFYIIYICKLFMHVIYICKTQPPCYEKPKQLEEGPTWRTK